jgi:hypothetical protein
MNIYFSVFFLLHIKYHVDSHNNCQSVVQTFVVPKINVLMGGGISVSPDITAKQTMTQVVVSLCTARTWSGRVRCLG